MTAHVLGVVEQPAQTDLRARGITGGLRPQRFPGERGGQQRRPAQAEADQVGGGGPEAARARDGGDLRRRPSAASRSSATDSAATVAACAGTSPEVRVDGTATRGSLTRLPSG